MPKIKSLNHTAGVLNADGYDPNALLDALIAKLALKNDAALATRLEVAPPVISKVRHHRLPVSASLLLRMYDVSGLGINELRTLMGMPRPANTAAREAR